MLLSTGVDLIEVERIRAVLERHGRRFLSRIFSEAEQRASAGRADSLAARFAAKEAVSKALGCGIGEVGWLDIEIRADEKKAPYLVLHGAGAKLARQKGLTIWSVSLSHTESHAVAMVVAAGNGEE